MKLPDRFEAREHLGSGGSGEVRAAWDRLLGREVAVKRVRPDEDEDRARVRREIAALLSLDLPGVVRLLDHLELDGETLLVMERVHGRPFPGEVGPSWEELAGPASALLSALAGVHALGLVHRDIKPSNVLIDETGRVVVVDFGLARGEVAGQDLTQRGTILGTPRYLSPEQMSGDVVDGRADLYAVGVMLYEHLTGSPPHRARSLGELWRERLLADAPSLGLRRPDLPECVIRGVDRLLSRSPSARFSSAEEARLSLCGAAEGLRLPWLGRAGLLERALATLRRGETLRIGGARGSGRTRTLSELALRLEGRARWLSASATPLGSLLPWGRPPEAADAASARAWARERLAQLRAEGWIPFADEGVDPWTLEALDGGVAALAVGPGQPGDLALTELSLEDLRPLFGGPDRFLHLREDAARLLLHRSEGRPAWVADELTRWLAEGLARWEPPRIILNREAIDRLSARPAPTRWEAEGPPLEPELEELLAWAQLAGGELAPEGLARAMGRPCWEVALLTERLDALGAMLEGRPRWPARALGGWPGRRRASAERAIALELPPGSPGRLRRLLSAGDAQACAEEALRLAEHAARAGRVGEGIAALRAALRVVQGQPGHPAERPLLDALVPALIEAEDQPSRRVLDYELARATCAAGDLAALADGWRQAMIGEAEAAWAALHALGPLPGRAERTRRAALAAAAQRLPVDEHEARVRRLLAEIPLDDPMRAQAEGWAGLVAYRRRSFAEAARIHESVAGRRPDAAGRLGSLLNAAGSALEAGALERALELARQAERLGAELRLPLAEARAAVLARSATVRLRAAEAVDEELLHDLGALGVPWLVATATATEAALAWRLGELPRAARLGEEAARRFERLRIPEAQLYASAVAAAGSADTATLARLAEQARACTLPEVALDVLALAALHGVAPPDARALATVRAAEIDPRTWDVPRGVYSVREALDRLGDGR